MAVNWMDNFNIYGTDAGRVARMLNGVYAEVGGVNDLIVDPDPTAGGGRVFVLYGNNGTVLRKVLPTARVTVGVANRIWVPNLPPASNNEIRLASFRDQNNVSHGFLTINASGQLRYYRTDTAGALVLLGETATPVIIANAWQHIETKVFLDVAVGTVEVRVEGVPVLVVAATRTTTNTAGAIANCLNVAMTHTYVGVSPLYIKDLIIWDDTTAFNNNFMGSCQVYKLIPSADVALNWTPNPADGIGFDKINEVTPDDDVRYIQAPFPLPAAYQCALSDLPVTVTSVRAVMPIHRSRKTDGGDGNLQIGVISAASTGLGQNRPITTAYTYWWDVYDSDPNGGIAWTRLSANAATLQLNRTV